METAGLSRAEQEDMEKRISERSVQDPGETGMERAKELFLQYGGNRFHMDREGDGTEYGSYCVSRETEERWAKEYISLFLESETQGREALRAYSTAAELLKSNRNGDWDSCLYYPLRAKHLDDVTILYMLSAGFRMAERAVKKHRFTRQEADAYLRELDGYVRSVLARAEEGDLTRAADYVMQEFSDPVYAAGYLNDLKEKWDGLFR